MDFGVRCHDYPSGTPETLFPLIRKDGSTTCQLAIRKSLPEDARDASRIRAALEKSGLSVGVLGNYVELALVDDDKRRESVRDFLQGVETAHALKAGCIGTETTRRELQPGSTREEALAALEKSLGAILPRAEELGVTVAIEPVYCHTMATPELTRRVLRDMRSPNLKVIFDAVNLLTPEDLTAERQEAMWQRAADNFGDSLAAAHVKGVRLIGGKMTACTLSESSADMHRILDLLKQLSFNGPVIREEIKLETARAELAMLHSWAVQ